MWSDRVRFLCSLHSQHPSSFYFSLSFHLFSLLLPRQFSSGWMQYQVPARGQQGEGKGGRKENDNDHDDDDQQKVTTYQTPPPLSPPPHCAGYRRSKDKTASFKETRFTLLPPFVHSIFTFNFRRVRKIAERYYYARTSVRYLSVRPHGTNGLPLDGLSRNFIYVYLSKICSVISSSNKVGK